MISKELENLILRGNGRIHVQFDVISHDLTRVTIHTYGGKAVRWARPNMPETKALRCWLGKYKPVKTEVVRRTAYYTLERR